MKYVLLLLFCALVFLVCFLVDKFLQKLFPKHELEKANPSSARRKRAQRSACCSWLFR